MEEKLSKLGIPVAYNIAYAYKITDESGKNLIPSNGQAGVGVNLATLGWCINHKESNNRLFLMIFKAKDFCETMDSDGTFNVSRCTRVGECDWKGNLLPAEKENNVTWNKFLNPPSVRIAARNTSQTRKDLDDTASQIDSLAVNTYGKEAVQKAKEQAEVNGDYISLKEAEEKRLEYLTRWVKMGRPCDPITWCIICAFDEGNEKGYIRRMEGN